MRAYTLALVVLATVLYTECGAFEVCPLENCVSTEKCDEPMKGNNLCHQQGTECCSIIKSEYRTHCRHHGGVCMDSCATLLQRNTVDCSGDQICCILI